MENTNQIRWHNTVVFLGMHGIYENEITHYNYDDVADYEGYLEFHNGEIPRFLMYFAYPEENAHVLFTELDKIYPIIEAAFINDAFAYNWDTIHIYDLDKNKEVGWELKSVEVEIDFSTK